MFENYLDQKDKTSNEAEVKIVEIAQNNSPDSFQLPTQELPSNNLNPNPTCENNTQFRSQKTLDVKEAQQLLSKIKLRRPNQATSLQQTDSIQNSIPLSR